MNVPATQKQVQGYKTFLPGQALTETPVPSRDTLIVNPMGACKSPSPQTSGECNDRNPSREPGVTYTPTAGQPRPQPLDPENFARGLTGKALGWVLLRQGWSVPEVSQACKRAPSTVERYLTEMAAAYPAPIFQHVTPETVERVAAAVRETQPDRLKPVFDHLGGTLPYLQIRLAKLALAQRDGETAQRVNQ